MYPRSLGSISASSRRRPLAVTSAITGITSQGNNVAGGDWRIKFKGANLPSRTSCTILWKTRRRHQLGYYTDCFFSYDDGVWHASYYEVGLHPHPCTGTFDSTGQRLVGLGGSGSTHYNELAGIGAFDYIASDLAIGSQTAVATNKDGSTWIAHGLRIEVIGGITVRHTGVSNLANISILNQHDVALANIPSPPNPAFYWGASDWTASGTSNDETSNADMRGFCIVNSNISLTHMQNIGALNYDSEVLAYCAANGITLWYLNMNPTPSDVSDKSGQGHNPVWDNGNRPTLFTQG